LASVLKKKKAVIQVFIMAFTYVFN